MLVRICGRRANDGRVWGRRGVGAMCNVDAMLGPAGHLPSTRLATVFKFQRTTDDSSVTGQHPASHGISRVCRWPSSVCNRGDGTTARKVRSHILYRCRQPTWPPDHHFGVHHAAAEALVDRRPSPCVVAGAVARSAGPRAQIPTNSRTSSPPQEDRAGPLIQIMRGFALGLGVRLHVLPCDRPKAADSPADAHEKVISSRTDKIPEAEGADHDAHGR